MTVIKVLGANCIACHFLFATFKEIAEEREWHAEIEYVTEESALATYDVQIPPAVILDEKVIQVGYRGVQHTAEIIEERLNQHKKRIF